MLLSSAMGLRAQGSISDPFFNHGQARSLNSRIIAPLQSVPGFVNQAITGMRVPNNRNVTLLAHLKNDYGYAVWDQAKTFTAAGRETALIPMVRPEGNAITGILVAVKDGSTFRYGVMDTENPFPYASAAPGTPGMPSLRDVLALFVIFNDALFGEVDCNLVQALRALSNNNVREQTAGSPKSCFVYVYYAGEYCEHIYGTHWDGTTQNMYSDCHDIYNYQMICDTDSADNDGGGGGEGVDNSGDGGNGNGSSGPGEGDNEIPNEANAPCTVTVTVLELSGVYSDNRTCKIQAQISGCNFNNCNVFFEGGDLACGASIEIAPWSISIPLGAGYRLNNPLCIAYRTSIHFDEQARNYIICGTLYVRVELLWHTLGITDSFGVITKSLDACYRCNNC